MSTAEISAAEPSIRRRSAARGSVLEPVFHGACLVAAMALLATLGGVLVSLDLGGWPAISKFGFGFLTNVTWDPVQDVYGAAGPVVGTLITSALALVIALPVAGGVAFFLVELATPMLRQPIGTAIELLAGIPSIVYGMWGLFIFAPVFAKWVEIPAMTAAPAGTIWADIVTGIPNGSGILAASIILAIMILPFMAATLRELLLTVPHQVRESAYGLGATTNEVVMKVTLPYVARGAVGAVMLGLGRALGETMAVTFIIGNSHDFPKGMFDAGSTIASTIANEFNEASGLQASALIALGLVLFLITFTVLALARLMLRNQARL